MTARGTRGPWALVAGLVVGLVATPAAGADSADDWLSKLSDALRGGRSSALQWTATIRDYTGSERKVGIELLRRSDGDRLRAVAEVRQDGVETPVLIAFEGRGEELVSWSWDVRFQSFVRLSNLSGTENFAGTHFRLEDLGFTGFGTRKNAELLREEGRAGTEIVLRSGEIEGHYTARIDTRLDPETALPRKVVVYDRTGARVWEQRYSRIKESDGVPWPWEWETLNPVTQEQTRLEVEWLRFDVPIGDDAFDLEVLARKMVAGEDPVEIPPLAAADDASGRPALALSGR